MILPVVCPSEHLQVVAPSQAMFQCRDSCYVARLPSLSNEVDRECRFASMDMSVTVDPLRIRSLTSTGPVVNGPKEKGRCADEKTSERSNSGVHVNRTSTSPLRLLLGTRRSMRSYFSSIMRDSLIFSPVATKCISIDTRPRSVFALRRSYYRAMDAKPVGAIHPNGYLLSIVAFCTDRTSS